MCLLDDRLQQSWQKQRQALLRFCKQPWTLGRQHVRLSCGFCFDSHLYNVRDASAVQQLPQCKACRLYHNAPKPVSCLRREDFVRKARSTESKALSTREVTGPFMSTVSRRNALGSLASNCFTRLIQPWRREAEGAEQKKRKLAEGLEQLLTEQAGASTTENKRAGPEPETIKPATLQHSSQACLSARTICSLVGLRQPGCAG